MVGGEFGGGGGVYWGVFFLAGGMSKFSASGWRGLPPPFPSRENLGGVGQKWAWPFSS